jgi:hypothetical protein
LAFTLSLQILEIVGRNATAIVVYLIANSTFAYASGILATCFLVVRLVSWGKRSCIIERTVLKCKLLSSSDSQIIALVGSILKALLLVLLNDLIGALKYNKQASAPVTLA